ncbi:hypothetical protein AURDEDRAFT_131459 [Auricularia subglabra TFB-10046 SS5]|uniref:F-box domain-containing protein n=1 Tax=Auricularia subglabra (strain TFB-10046 / SS5) TaxID=717982 RepID=J0LBP9_AURST|nr:hypothetical protein AURDEDRAFT_131459 [Auricularia subglabra TFB-10046 SS5]
MITSSISLCHVACLPSELFHRVLDNLEQPDVLSAAGVSRRWRLFATNHRKYYAAASFRIPRSAPWKTEVDAQGSKFCSVLHVCRERRVRLKIDIDVKCDPSCWVWDNDIHRAFGWFDGPALRNVVGGTVLLALQDALSLVIILRIWAYPGHDSAIIYTSLRVDAPLLEVLQLDLGDPPTSTITDVAQLPYDLFALNAPLLHTVRLRDVGLPAVSVPAFDDVHTVDLWFTFQPPLGRIMICFPRAAILNIKCGAYSSIMEESALAASFDHRVRVLKLSPAPKGQYPPDILAALRRSYIPYLQVDFHEGLLGISPFVDHLPENLRLVLHTGSHTSERIASVEPVHPDALSSDTCRRTFIFRRLDLDALLLYQLSLLSDRLTHIEILHSDLVQFVSTLGRPAIFWPRLYVHCHMRIINVLNAIPPLTMSVGDRDIPLDCIYEGDDVHALKCPKLNTLVLRVITSSVLRRFTKIQISSFEFNAGASYPPTAASNPYASGHGGATAGDEQPLCWSSTTRLIS